MREAGCGAEVIVMGRIAGIKIKNYGSLRDVKLGKVLSDSNVKTKELTNVNAIIGKSGTGKSTLADARTGICAILALWLPVRSLVPVRKSI